MNLPAIGWIGLGKMGDPMSKRLLKAGYPLTVYNRSKEKEETLKQTGAATAGSPALLLQQSELVIIMVSDDRAIQDIFNGEQGLFSTTATGRILINMSTVSPAISREMAALCLQRGHHYLDAPVSGSVKQAEEGQLVIMVGGEASIFEKTKPVLEQLGKLAMLIGDNGAGNTAKLAINTLLGIYAQGLAEAMALAQHNGIRKEDLMTLINNGALGSAFIKIKGDALIQDNYKAVFALKHIVKDLGLAKDIGLNTPLGETVLKTYKHAEPALGEEDIIAVAKQVGVV